MGRPRRSVRSLPNHTAMSLRYHFILACVAACAFVSIAAEPAIRVRLEMWDGCLCAGPKHSRTYDQLKDERAKRMLYGADATVSAESSNLPPLDFLRQNLRDNKSDNQAAFYRNCIVYRRALIATTYTVHFRGSPRKLKMSDMRDGDLIVYYKEVY